MLDRRQFLISSLAASLSYLATGCRQFSPPWESAAYRKKIRSQVAILGAKNYEIPLREIVLRGLKLFRINVQGKTVVLKPNLVEYDPAGVINTRHIHTCAHGMYVLDGTLRTDGGDYGPGHFVWFPAGIEMEHGATAEKDVTVLFITNRRFDIHYLPAE